MIMLKVNKVFFITENIEDLRSIPTERLRLQSRNFPLMFHVARCERLHRN